ncbi:uncharacterized protein LOC110812637 [Carica papaya]|uniref:uncharacterized protein LOC110812637 n=1 Tax=Carica papaya TaxID=3649 RepID=UPI000B8CEFF1|nr:uncharacterized protein LOC110812637 [Carica papaya]
MEKKNGRMVYLGVQTCKKPAHRNRKGLLLDKVLAYLKTDCYMYAPLLSLPPSGFAEPMPIFSSATESSKGRENGFSKKVEDYMKSDSYMYSSMVSPPPSPSLGMYSSTYLPIFFYLFSKDWSIIV